MKVLLVDDEDGLRLSLADDLREAGHEVFDFLSPRAALEFLAGDADVAAIVTDWRMPDMNGLEFLQQARQIAGDAQVIVITAYGTVQTAVDAVKRGAYDYLIKPFEIDELLLALDRIAQYRTVIEQNRELLAKIDQHSRFHRLLGRSPVMARLFEQLAMVAPSSSTVLITGETGTGKELVAEAIHSASPRRSNPLVKVSCAALARDILESELFGHERGAFTGAIRAKVGRFEMAQGGTLYLDDVDDIPLESQVKLLRVLQERTLERVGGATPITLDVRVIASTKFDLQSRVAAGRFREDLFYRLNVVPIQLPPLRHRREDIPVLAQHFLEKHAGAKRLLITPPAMDALVAYSWPGNVRQLEHVMERLALTARAETIDCPDLPAEILCPQDPEIPRCLGQRSLDDIVDDLAKQVIRAALAKTGGNRARAAALLQIPPSTLRSRMEKYGLE